MEGIALIVCEQAILRMDGSYDILRYYGAHSYINQFPVEPRFVIFWHLVFDPAEKGDHVVKIKVFDPSDNVSTIFRFVLTVPEQSFEWVSWYLVQGFRVGSAGRYKIVLEVDDKKLMHTDKHFHKQGPFVSNPSIGFQPRSTSKE